MRSWVIYMIQNMVCTCIYLLFFPHGVEKEKVRLTKREKKKLTDTINLITFFFFHCLIKVYAITHMLQKE